MSAVTDMWPMVTNHTSDGVAVCSPSNGLFCPQHRTQDPLQINS